MSILTIALLQMTAHGNDQEANRAKGERFCRRAHGLGADIALFPEMWNIGYTPYRAQGSGPDHDRPDPEEEEQRLRQEWQAQAVGLEDDFVVSFRDLARELDMAIALTYLERWPGAPRNTVSLIDRHGQIVLTYAKVHTCDFTLLEASCTPGDAFHACALDTAQGEVHVGAMICYDREHPESARMLMLQGAEIILTPNACELERHRLGQFKTRAYENMVGLAMANYPTPKYNGHSIAVHPVACDRQGRPQDTLVVEAGEQEGIYLAPFDLDAMRAYRAREIWGNAYRKPARYGLLTSAAVAPPFIRKDARR